MQKLQSKCPKNLREHSFTHTFQVHEQFIDKFWRILQLRETFVKGQLFPYRVEFDAPQQHGPFQESELNIHHGPGLSVHGAIGEVSQSYRSLKYFYGSYVLSFRLIRPTLLEFSRDESSVTVRLNSYVHPWILPFWKLGNALFWKAFGLEWSLKSKASRTEPNK